jgi:hypothetical protein
VSNGKPLADIAPVKNAGDWKPAALISPIKGKVTAG